VVNKIVDFWNLVDIYNPDIIVTTESWLHQNISDMEIGRSDYKIFRRDRYERGGGVFICMKIEIDSIFLWTHQEVEMISVQISNKGENFDIISSYRPPNEYSFVTLYKLREKLDSIPLGRKLIIAGDFNLPGVNWYGQVIPSGEGQYLINSLIWEYGLTQVVHSPTGNNAILDVFSCSALGGSYGV
jgi:hypothetical protein